MTDSQQTTGPGLGSADQAAPGPPTGGGGIEGMVIGSGVPDEESGLPSWSMESEVTDEPLPDNYPTEWQADVVLRDGSIAHVRPITPSDGDRLRRFHAGQSEESIYLRFFAPMRELSDQDVHRFTHVDYKERGALVVTVRGAIIGVGRFDCLPDETVAEVAFNISDHFQGKGVGSVLLEHLAAIAQERGISRFVADVLPQNRKMMKVFIDAGYEVGHHYDDGVISVEFQIAPTAESIAVRLSREHRAEAESMADVLSPASLAIVGVSRRANALGSIVLDNILDGGYTGRVHIVNLETDTVRGLFAYDRVSSIGEQIDLAIIAVPADAVLDVVEDCASVGVRAVVVISSGFAEESPHGEMRQAELLRLARAAGMRVLGPLSFGFVNNHPDVMLNATLARDNPPAGGLSLFSQSGGLGVGLLASATRRRLGLSTFVACGNRVDVSANDLMQYWIDDDDTLAVGMYIESIGNPRKFSRIARQLSLRKPVITVKQETSRKVPPGHRARPTKVPPAAFDALLAQAGAIQAKSVHELIDVAELVTLQPLPRGDRVAVVGNSDGLNEIVLQKALRSGLQVPHEVYRVPLGGSAQDVEEALVAAYESDDIDSVIITLIPPLADSDEIIALSVAHSAWGYDKPCVAAFFGMRDVSGSLRKGGQPGQNNVDGHRRVIPLYKTPLDAVAALAAATKYAVWRDGDHPDPVRPAVDSGEGARIIDQALDGATDGVLLDEDTTAKLLEAYGIHLWRTFPAPDPDAAVAAAEQIGYPVVLRSLADGVRNVPGAGGVRSDLRGAEAVRGAYEALVGRLPGWQDPVLVVQRMAPLGTATVIESHEDPLFGPVVSFGIAGVASELLGDVGYAIPRLTKPDVHRLVTTRKAAPLLAGYRGHPPSDIEALEDLILRVATLAEDMPDIADLELNPVSAHANGVSVLGARIHLDASQVRTDAGRRALA